MEPTKQGGDGPSDLGASNDPAQRRDGSSSRRPPPSSLVEQTMPPPPLPLNPPQLLHHQQQPYPWQSVPSFIPFAFPDHFANASLDPHAFVHPHSPFANQLAPSSHQWTSALHWASMPRPSSSANVPQPRAATAFSQWGPNAILDPYASAALTAPPAHLTESQRLRSFSQAIGDLPPRAFRASLLEAPKRPTIVMTSRQVSKRVVSMLDQGEQDLRVWVIQAVSRDVRRVMRSELGSAVFLALLRAVTAEGEEQSQELRVIVQAAASRRDMSLMSVATSEAGEKALKELFRVVAKNDRLCRQLFNCLVDGWRMDQSNGPELLQYLFTELGYFYYSIFIHRVAVPRYDDMVTSKFGWRCMLICLWNAKCDAEHTEFPALTHDILNYTVDIAKCRYGNLFLQEILKSGYHVLLKDSIRDRLEKEDLQELSTHPLGSYVIEACYVPHPAEPVLPLVRRGLDAFKSLSDTQLVELARDRSASRVLCNLLRTAKDIEPPSAWSRTTNLARRIVRGVTAEQGNPFARQVMEVLQEVLSVCSARTPPRWVQL